MENNPNFVTLESQIILGVLEILKNLISSIDVENTE